VKKIQFFIILVVILLASIFLSLMLGGSRLALSGVLYALLHPSVPGADRTIVWDIRIPRTILGLLIGAGLALSGCVFQGMLRNPLADPYTLGISGGAALGASMGIILGFEKFLGYYGLPLCAFAGALVSIFLIYALAVRKNCTVTTLVLVGVVLSFLFSSVVTLLLSVARPEKMNFTILWLMGDLSSAEPKIILPVAVFVLSGIAVTLLFSRDIDVLSLGEEKAGHLGVDVNFVRRILFLSSSLVTGACVASAGIIGFVGLMVPHFIRGFTGPAHERLLPASAIGGAALLILCDTLGRTVISPLELPVGVITGIFGGLFFLVFFLRSGRKEIF